MCRQGLARVRIVFDRRAAALAVAAAVAVEKAAAAAAEAVEKAGCHYIPPARKRPSEDGLGCATKVACYQRCSVAVLGEAEGAVREVAEAPIISAPERRKGLSAKLPKLVACYQATWLRGLGGYVNDECRT